MNVFGGFVVGPGGDDFRVVAVIERATDPNRAFDDPADNAGVGRRCLTDVQGASMALLPQSIESKLRGTIALARAGMPMERGYI
ncbi:hypothetical protein [Pseudomonas sp. TH31]|uniref:hypothetical protein n=1 Tax=Pseudomonas sp. TH31 TaxID=2796396 RepID=UPI00313C5361